tara:strand:+ start:7182 stop:7334 length:153 start_codon:yes stop_codon:yes gene_type:complete
MIYKVIEILAEQENRNKRPDKSADAFDLFPAVIFVIAILGLVFMIAPMAL